MKSFERVWCAVESPYLLSEPESVERQKLVKDQLDHLLLVTLTLSLAGSLGSGSYAVKRRRVGGLFLGTAMRPKQRCQVCRGEDTGSQALSDPLLPEEWGKPLNSLHRAPPRTWSWRYWITGVAHRTRSKLLYWPERDCLSPEKPGRQKRGFHSGFTLLIRRHPIGSALVCLFS